MKSDPKWTVLIVNHKSHYYLKNQMRILFESNCSFDFEVLIIDNSSPSEFELLKVGLNSYLEKYNNIRFIYYLPKGIFNSEGERDEHGESVNFAMKYIDTQYILIHDPDFFWTQKSYLNVLEYELKENIVVGAPYPNKAAGGAQDFPCSFGCAYITEYVKNLDFKGEYLDDMIIESYKKLYPNKDGYCAHPTDMGYKVRLELSKKKYKPFSQDKINLSHAFGVQGIMVSMRYDLNKKEIGWHLFGGSRTPDNVIGLSHKSKWYKSIVYSRWIKTREKLSYYFYLRSQNKLASSLFLRWQIVSAKMSKLFSIT